MSDIRFSDFNKSNDRKVIVTVKIGKKVIGHIKATGDGFAYHPKGNKTHGIIFNTVREVAYDVTDESYILTY